MSEASPENGRSHAVERTDPAVGQSRRSVLAASVAGIFGAAVGGSPTTAQETTALDVDLAAEELAVGETTTATFRIVGAPDGSQGVSIEIGVDEAVAAITGVELGEHAPPGLEDRINGDIEDAGGAVPSIDAQSFDPDGIDATEYELATFQLEATAAGTTPIDLLDATVNDPNGQNPEVDYERLSLTVADGEKADTETDEGPDSEETDTSDEGDAGDTSGTQTGTDEGTTDDESNSDDTVPGFGLPSAVAGLLAGAGVLRRRFRES